MMPSVDRSTAPTLGPTPAPRISPVRREIVGPGVELVMLPAPGPPLVVLEIVVAAGSAHDPPGGAGLADLTAHLLPEGAAGLGMFEIAERISALGGRLSVGVGHDAVWLRLVALRSAIATGLELLADLVLRPSFPGAEVERLLAEREVDLQRERDDPAIVASRTFAAELYGPNHAYGQPPPGTLASIRGLTRDTFVAFYRRVWRPGGATLVAVGPFDPGELRPLAERILADWPAGRPPAADVAPPKAPGRGIALVDRPSSAQSDLRVGHIGVARAHPDHEALLALNHLLGGSIHSRISLNLRERRGWTYGVRSRFDFRRGPGPFYVAASVDTRVTRAALEEIGLEIERAAAGPIEEEERVLAVHGLTRSLPRLFETAPRIADRVREIVVYDLPDDHYVEYPDRLRGVTIDDIARTAADHLHPHRLLSVIVGDAEAVADDLAGLGPIRHRPWKPSEPTAPEIERSPGLTPQGCAGTSPESLA